MKRCGILFYPESPARAGVIVSFMNYHGRTYISPTYWTKVLNPHILTVKQQVVSRLLVQHRKVFSFYIPSALACTSITRFVQTQCKHSINSSYANTRD